ncbi:C2 calcium-dependent domain-containing protein 4C [Danio rerio]|uniref:C2 calcium-dependent domain-containing protein 4C n=1 Tax=Danio rerio TaxID=7955 RepID=A0A8M2B9A9_DANRE|nr:C2 calcium-dependent domain-containing protein 4C-like [Danio rerio]|eukprot:XP_005162533.1 C2 calcium-dependent domain-containing protein 4C-like [Danio rerio]
MWILQKVQEGAQNLPLQINHLISSNKEELSARLQTNILNKMHSNVLTQDKIPDFFLPPKLAKRCYMVDTEKISQCLNEEKKVVNTPKTLLPRPDTTLPLKASMNRSTTALNKFKPLPYSMTCFESGLFESPNTRRKESLFHSALTSYKVERMTVKSNKHSSSEVMMANTKSDTSSADSSPYSTTTPPLRRKDFTDEYTFSEDTLQKDLNASMNEKKKVHSAPDKKLISKVFQHAKVLQTSHCSKLAPPVQFPLDMLHCQERFHQEHVLPLPQRGKVRISAFKCSSAGSSTTIRIRVVSVEDLRDPGDLRPLTCSLTLTIIPGKLQQQNSAIIRNCRNPVFNEDFFFQEPEEHGSLKDFALRLKVLDKASGLGRGMVLGIVIKPLYQLVPL